MLKHPVTIDVNMLAPRSLFFFGLFWSAIVLFFDGLMVVPTVRQILALQFPSAPGVVLSSEVKGHGEGETIFGMEINYTYTVGGREFSGRRYRYASVFTSRVPHRDWANEVVAAHPPEAKVTVFYNPVLPQDAVLARGVSGMDLFALLFMTPFNAVMLGLWSAGWTWLRRRWFKPVADGVKIISRMHQTRVRLTRFSPLAAAVATAGALAFLSCFIIAFGFGGFDPSVRTMLVTWSVILASSLGVGGWHWFQILSGKYDLVLDASRSAVELPRTQGRKTRRWIPLSSIESVQVETIESPKKDDQSDAAPTYAPTLTVSGEPNPTERLVEWDDAARAEAFVAWLREKLQVRSASVRAEKAGQDAGEIESSGGQKPD